MSSADNISCKKNHFFRCNFTNIIIEGEILQPELQTTCPVVGLRPNMSREPLTLFVEAAGQLARVYSHAPAHSTRSRSLLWVEWNQVAWEALASQLFQRALAKHVEQFSLRNSCLSPSVLDPRAVSSRYQNTKMFLVYCKVEVGILAR